MGPLRSVLVALIVIVAIAVSARSEWPEEGDGYAMVWALLETSDLSEDPTVTRFKTEEGCRLAEKAAKGQQGIIAFCVPVLSDLACDPHWEPEE